MTNTGAIVWRTMHQFSYRKAVKEEQGGEEFTAILKRAEGRFHTLAIELRKGGPEFKAHLSDPETLNRLLDEQHKWRTRYSKRTELVSNALYRWKLANGPEIGLGGAVLSYLFLSFNHEARNIGIAASVVFGSVATAAAKTLNFHAERALKKANGFFTEHAKTKQLREQLIVLMREEKEEAQNQATSEKSSYLPKVREFLRLRND